uniref:Anti_prolifrtn domain-containing protein n=1 Tax=Caenorhabditis japonica TaxID=281687 RepID=A0A8R1DQZ4_CAEJA
MYTEVKEVVNFVCRYMFGRVPRRATGIFGAELGNFLVSQFASSWDTRNPQSGENERVISINCTEGSSKCFESSAMESGLPLEEVLAHLPARIRIHTNPGDVQMLIVDNGVKIPIWSGDVNADDNYQPIPAYIVTAASSRANPYTNLGAAGQPVLFGKKPLPTNDLGEYY